MTHRVLALLFVASLVGCSAGELRSGSRDGGATAEPEPGAMISTHQPRPQPWWWSWWKKQRRDLGVPRLDGAPGGAPDQQAPKLDQKAAPTPDQALAPKPDQKVAPKPDLGAPPPPPTGPLPTWVALDWAAFPTDPGPSYPVSGTTWVVKTSGSDSNPGTDTSPLRTIAAALAKASSGDRVRVHAGTYAEGTPGDWRALVMSKNNVILTSAPGESVTVTPKSSSYKHGVAMLGDNLVLNGINLQGFSPLISLGRDTSAQKKIVISNLTAQAATGGFDGIVSYPDNTGKGFAAIDGLLLKNVVVKGASLSISCNAGPCNSWRLENVTVQGGGTGSGSGADAIAVESGDNLLFLNVDVSGATADGIDTKATRVVVWGCHVHDVARNGVKLWYGGDIVNTSVHHTGADAAVNVKYGERVRILHSVIAWHNKGAGTSYNMTFRHDDNGPILAEIINSIIFNTSGGAYFSNQATLSIQNSIFFGIDNGTVLDRGSVHLTLAGGATALTAAGFGSGNLFVDPQLDPVTMHPKAGSPAVNKGKQLPALYPATDLAGQPRVKSGAPDIGAFEDY